MEILVAVITALASLAGVFGGAWLGKRTASRDAENDRAERHADKTREAIAELLAMRSEADLVAYKALVTTSRMAFSEESPWERLENSSVFKVATEVEELISRLGRLSNNIKLLAQDYEIEDRCEQLAKTSRAVLQLLIIPAEQRSESFAPTPNGQIEPLSLYEKDFNAILERAMELFARPPAPVAKRRRK